MTTTNNKIKDSYEKAQPTQTKTIKTETQKA